MRYFFSSLLFFCSFIAVAQDSLQVAFYNLFRFPHSPPANRELLLRDIIDSIRPDLLMACEIINKQGAQRILNTSFSNLPDSFAKATFYYSESAIEDPLQQMVFYNTRKLILTHQQVLYTSVRDINHYSFVLNTTSLEFDPVHIEVFVAHFKSSTGAANRNTRADMADTFLSALNKIPRSHHVLFGGDFNLYQSDNEPAYHKIIDSTNHIRMTDPIDMPGNWHNNPSFSSIHTQATRTSAAGFGLGGATGGLDDRFDFIWISENGHTDPRFSYVKNSYKAYGNNGNCFDKSIHDTACTGPYSPVLRKKLHDMSDHAPVVMKFRTNQVFTTRIQQKGNPPEISLLNGNIIDDELLLKINGQVFNDQVLVFNSLGQLLKTCRIETGRHKIILIDMRGLSSGLYFLRLKSSPSGTIKFLKK